ncbi:HAD family hydrolase [Cupriavidus basilensis]
MDGQRYRLGRLEFVAALGTSASTDREGISTALAASERSGATLVWLGSAKGAQAVFVLADIERAQSARLLAALRALGVTCHLVSGDTPATVGWWADHFQIARREAASRQKASASMWRTCSVPVRLVLAVGDGINDAPVLAQAQVSIAIGSGAAGAGRRRCRADPWPCGRDRERAGNGPPHPPRGAPESSAGPLPTT